MASENWEVQEHIGNQVRRLRLSRNLSLRELAQRSGLNINTLSLIENGKTSPSVATLQQLAVALGVRIMEFFEGAEAEQEVIYTPAERRPQRSAGGSLIQNLTARLVQHELEAFVVHLKPAGEELDRHISHAGWEFVYVLSGVVEYRVNGQTYELKQGDSLAFAANLPHCWRNPLEDQTAQLLLIFVPSRQPENFQRRHFTFNSQSKELTMKIALITDDGQTISRHFGRATHYLVLSLENGRVVNRELRPKLGHRHFHSEHEENHEHDHAETADQHHERHVSMAEVIADCAVLICGGMGRPAYESMLRLNIKPLVTDLTDIDQTVEAFLKGQLVDHTELLH